MANNIGPSNRQRQRLQLELSDLSGGFVSHAASYNIDERFLIDIQNMELVHGMWQKRRGFHLSGSFFGIANSPNSAKGLHVFNQQGNLHLLGAFEGNLYDTYYITKENAGKLIASGFPTTRRIRFTDFRNQCYFTHGQDKMMKYDGYKVTYIDTPVGHVLATYDNRVLLAGIKGDPLTIYYSEQGNGDIWNALNYLVLDGKSGEKVIALIPIQGKLYIFTNKSIFSLTGTMDNFAVSKEVEGIGATSFEAIQVFGNKFYFMDEKGKVYEYDGGSFPVEISYNITSYVTSAFSKSAIQNVVTTHYKNSVWFTMDNTSIPEKRVTLVYYPNDRAWTRFVGIPAAAYTHINGALFFTGVHNSGAIYQYDTQYKDATRYIEGSLKTAKWGFRATENIKRFKTLYVRGAIQGGGGNGFDIEFLVDDSKVASVRVTSDIAAETEVWGSNAWGEMYWGSAPSSSGALWGQSSWEAFEWAGAEIKYAPRWGTTSWGAFNWGDHTEGSLQEDVGKIYRKLYLSQYNIISGKMLQLVFRDRSPDHGFRIENLTLEYIQKGAR